MFERAAADQAAELEASLREVLETMFFADVLGESACSPAFGDFVYCVEFQGEPPGRLRVSLSRPAASALAAVFLAQHMSEVTELDTGHVAGEFANMVCGSFLSRYGSGKLFTLSSPAPVDPAEPVPAGATEAAYELDEGSVRLCLSWD